MSISTAQEVALEQIMYKLISAYRPQRVILFGSWAYGQPDEHSDIDLLIVKETDASPLERRVQVRRLVADTERRIPFSPLVLTPTELEHQLSLGNPFYREILAQGKELYSRG
jgi:predicted nucleotidyltransferase